MRVADLSQISSYLQKLNFHFLSLLRPKFITVCGVFIVIRLMFGSLANGTTQNFQTASVVVKIEVWIELISNSSSSSMKTLKLFNIYIQVNESD